MYTSLKFNAADLPEAVKRYNQLITHINAIAPQIAGALDGAKITNERIDKKTRTKIAAIIDAENMPKYCRVFIEKQYQHSLYLQYDFHAPRGSHGCEYIHSAIMIAHQDNGATWQAITPDTIKPIKAHEAIKQYNQILRKTAEIERLNQDINQLERAAAGFITVKH